MKQEFLHELKHYISSLQQDNKTDYMDEYSKAMQDRIASLKCKVMFLRGEVKEKNVFIEQINNYNKIIIIEIIIIIKITIIRKIVNLFLIRSLHPLKITVVMLQLQIKLMILILLLEVRNLKNIITLTITIKTTIIIVI